MTELRRVLFRALAEAGALIHKNIDRPKSVRFKNKSSINLVTWVDSACDALIRRIIRRRFPRHDFLTEESAPTQHHSDYKWIIDPLDGTTNYAHRYPQVGVSIALEYTPLPPTPSPGGRGGAQHLRSLSRRERVVAEGDRERLPPEVILAGVYDPFRNELFWAEKNRGAFLKSHGPTIRLRVSKTRRLKESLLMTGFPYDRHKRADFYLSYVSAFLKYIQGIRRAGAAALDLCWVACGRVDGYWEWRLKPWDSAAGKLIVEEAGGRMSDFKGKPFSVYGEQTLASNGKIHGEMLKVMKHLARKREKGKVKK